MEAAELKESALRWLRWEKQLRYIATEFAFYGGIADVYGASKTRTIEVEVKTNHDDIWRDLRKGKHDFYKNHTEETRRVKGQDITMGDDVPQFFYLCVPVFLNFDAEQFRQQVNEKYGIMTVDSCGILTIAEQARRIHNDRPSENLLERIVGRMSNEIIAVHNVKNRFNRFMERVIQETHKITDPQVGKPEEGS